MTNSIDVIRKLASLKLPLLHKWKYHDAISDAIIHIEQQDKLIMCYKSDLEETLEIVANQKNVLQCEECDWYDKDISFCNNCHLPRESTFYCADGKPKTDSHKK